MTHPKGVFCLETDWWNNLRRSSTVRPILEMLHQWDDYRVPYIHRDVGTPEEFWHYVKKWAQRAHHDYPILYLAFHGEKGKILAGADGRRKESTVSLDRISEVLEGRCHRRIIYFGSCDTLKIHGNRLRAFLKRTEAVAVCGYTRPVDWMESSILDLAALSAMQNNAPTVPGARAIKKRIYDWVGPLASQLGFRMCF